MLLFEEPLGRGMKMSVIVRLGRKKAILCAGQWSCADRRVEEQLQAALEIWIHKTGGLPIGHGDPDLCTAEALSGEFGFEIVLRNKPGGAQRGRHIWRSGRSGCRFTEWDAGGIAGRAAGDGEDDAGASAGGAAGGACIEQGCGAEGDVRAGAGGL